MPRNYEKETEWEKEKYKRLVAKIDKNLAEKFLNKIDKNGNNEKRNQKQKRKPQRKHGNTRHNPKTLY